ncbi:uncharacterized protein LOC105182867 isoform X1 [Harpegnathos saltator]|uniref:uncharacterized protein LOC105182867 isoform X1 n=2 Tax=Harpegnathos saltator TaxID=610380 RepID=UPI000DBEE8DF|nr:uncharacterized protein LOC105182867 isoform X1 [Harpegnathos saltator]
MKVRESAASTNIGLCSDIYRHSIVSNAHVQVRNTCENALPDRFFNRTLNPNMVSHFGEVVFPSSRAFWDDEDEYELAENLENRLKLCFHWQKNKPEDIKKFIVIEGDPLIPFAQQCLCHKIEESCIIKDENDKKVSVIYEMDKQLYLCIILPQFNTKDTGIFINEISDLLLKTENTLAIMCRHMSQFQGTNIPNDPSFLRILTTKNINDFECEVKTLEQPNIIFGVGAGVLSHAEFMNMSAKLYILYIDGFVLDSKCAEPILKVLNNELPGKLQHLKFAENFFSKGNLYM